MPDIYLTSTGDLDIAPNGDLAMVPDVYHHYSQQAYIRMMTEAGDFVMYPNLGASLDKLNGMPNNPQTGEFGRQLIIEALDREGVFTGVGIDVKAVPVSYNSIRFDVYIIAGSRNELILSIEQDLGLSFQHETLLG